MNQFLLRLPVWCLSSCLVVAYGICIKLFSIEGCFGWIKKESSDGWPGCGHCGSGFLFWFCLESISIPVL